MENYLNTNFDPTEIYDLGDELPLWSAPFGIKLLNFIDYKPNISAIDIGFGTGFPLIELAMRLGTGSVVYGIEKCQDAISRASKKINCYGISNIRIIEGDAESIPLNNNTVDLITSNNGINNIDNINKAISECSRIIKKNGQFVQTMNLDKTMFEFYGQLENVFSELKMNREIGLMHEHIHQKRRPLDEIISMLQKQGFMIKDMEHDQFNYKFTDGSAMLTHFFIRFAFMDAWIKLIPGDKLEQVFNEIETRLNEQARILGGIKLSIPFVVINAIKK